MQHRRAETDYRMQTAVGVGQDGYRDILGIAEGCKEDKAGWSNFLAYLKKRGLTCPDLFISDKCIGLIESLAEYYPDAKWQRCTVHWYRNVFSVGERIIRLKIL